MKVFSVVCCLAGIVAVAVAAEDKAKAGIQGRYTVIRGERNGKPLPDADFKDSVLVIKQDSIAGTDKDKKEFFAATYTLDTSKKPWTIKMTSTAPQKGEVANGIVEQDGETLKICYALPGGKTPTTFTAGEKQHCFVLKKVKE